MKYEMTDISIEFFGVKLRRIRSLIDFGEVKKGDLGGYIEKYDNLSQVNKSWVSGDAKVSKNPICISGFRHHITITDTNISIGCMVFEISHWQKNIRKIGKENSYTENEVSTVIKLLSCFSIECE